MDNEKNLGHGELASGKSDDFRDETSTRARNRTVMLTPDITGEVRARLARELEPAPVSGGFSAPTGVMSADRPHSAGSGFGSTYQPAGTGRSVDSGAHYGSPPPAPRQVQHTPPPEVHHAAPSGVGAVWTKPSSIVGFLVSFDTNENGDVFELRSGRLIITSELAANSNYIYLDDPTISPMHAIMRISSGGEIQVLDQLSEHGTKIVRFGSEVEEELSGDKSTIEHGDIIKFGKRTFHVCVLARQK